MLAIRMQRTGRKGYAQFRIVVQDIRQTPSSGRVIAGLGNYNPHSKEAKLDLEKTKFYISNGAHPSERVAAILKKEGVKLPSWVVMHTKQKKTTKSAEKLRKNRPAVEKPVEAAPVAEEAVEETKVEETATEEPTVEAEAPVVEVEVPVEDTPTEVPAAEPETEPEVKVEKPAEEPKEAKAKSPAKPKAEPKPKAKK